MLRYELIKELIQSKFFEMQSENYFKAKDNSIELIIENKGVVNVKFLEKNNIYPLCLDFKNMTCRKSKTGQKSLVYRRGHVVIKIRLSGNFKEANI